MRYSLAPMWIAVVLLRALPACAQAADGGPDLSAMRVRIGPLLMNPTIAVSNVGIDQNVFNDPPDKDPKHDFTATVVPTTDVWLHAGPTWVTASLNESITWYQKYVSERSANTRYKLGWSVPGSRVSFKIDGSYLHARERPGFEIDTRALRTQTDFNGALDFHALSSSFIGLTAARSQTRFADDAMYLDTNLRTALNRVSTTYGLNLRHQLSPLTSITFAATRSNDRFEFTPERDSNSTSAQTSLTFDPEALIKGSVSLGYTSFQPVAGDLPGYRGLIGSANLTYVLLGSTRFALTGSRGVQYSYDVNQPYYVQSGIGGSVAQQIAGPFDVQVRADIEVLAYRDRLGALVDVTDRTDHVTSYGVGVGYHMGKDWRLAFNVDKVARDTRVVDHQYDNFKFGSALTYGF